MNPLSFFANSNRILGLNARQLDYISTFNNPKDIQLANDKLATKARLEEAGLSVPPTLLVISSRIEIATIDWEKLPPSFVIKPVSSSQGKGVLVVFGKSKKYPDVWITSDGRRMTKQDLEAHLVSILAGVFSETQDRAFIEERVKIHPSLKAYARRGTPDVRVIVFNNVPVMAELRLPTLRSSGRSNLHMGGIGAGVDLANGTTTHAIYLGTFIRFLPSTRTLLSGVVIPSWNKVLSLAVQAQRATGLGFAGIDIGINHEGKPIIFEVNAQPGLAIQNANLSGLRQHLERVKGLHIKEMAQGVSLAQALFGGEVERHIEAISGKKTIGPFEIIHIETTKGSWPVMAKIDTGAYSSSIHKELLKRLGIPASAIESRTIASGDEKEIRQLIPLAFTLKGERVESELVVSDRKALQYDITLGRKDLKNFLIDPSIKKPRLT